MPTATREPLPAAKPCAAPIQKGPTPVPSGSLQTTGGQPYNNGSK
jgi:hypothetical protein